VDLLAKCQWSIYVKMIFFIGSIMAKHSSLWLYGQHPCEAALKNEARKILMVVSLNPAIATHPAVITRQLKTRVADKGWFEKTFPGAVHQGVAVQVAPLESMDIRDLAQAEQSNQIVVILDQVTDPHNIGAILRSAAAFGAKAVIMTDRHAPDESAILAKSASGALELVPLIRAKNLAQALQELKNIGFWVYGFAESGSQLLPKVDLKGKVALLLGAEGSGMRRLTQENCDFLLRLPTSEHFSTLNVSNAAAIALYQTFIAQNT
jgi:23S rRNA (guanosine2251-2'-O)-methyltransferase